MWENRCKVAVSGVGFSKVTRSADIPLAAHALEAVKGAVEDSGLTMADIDGLATYPELPATGHQVIDGVTIVSVNCMLAMLKLAIDGAHRNHRHVGICGEAPANYPEIARYLAGLGIDSISVNPASILRTMAIVRAAEQELVAPAPQALAS